MRKWTNPRINKTCISWPLVSKLAGVMKAKAPINSVFAVAPSVRITGLSAIELLLSLILLRLSAQ